MTIQEIDMEIRRLTELRRRKEEELQNKEYTGKLYRNTNGSIGKIEGSYHQNGKTIFIGQSLWFDDEADCITNEEEHFTHDELEIITEGQFLATLNGWTKRLAASFGIKESREKSEPNESKEECEAPSLEVDSPLLEDLER